MAIRKKCQILCVVLILVFHPQVQAAQEQQSEIEMIFAIDAGLYLNDDEIRQLTAQTCRLWMDLVRGSNIKIGYVVFADTAAVRRSPSLVQNDVQRDQLIEELNSQKTEMRSASDVCVGLEQAGKLLTKDCSSLVVLFGAADSPSGQQLDTLLTQFRQDDVAVYTVGVNSGRASDTKVLTHIAGASGGVSFELPSPQMLPEIPGRVLAAYEQSKLTVLGSFTADGNERRLNLTIADDSAQSADLIVLYDGSVPKFELYQTDGSKYSPDLVESGEGYALIRIHKPQKGLWSLLIQGDEQEKITVSMLSRYDLSLKMAPLPKEHYVKGDRGVFSAQLYSEDEVLPDQSLYQNANAQFCVKNLQTGSQYTARARIQAQALYGEYSFQHAGQYEVRFSITGEKERFYRESAAQSISVSPAQLSSKTKSSQSAVWLMSDLWNEQKKIPLSEWIQWDEDCELEISLEQTDGAANCLWEYDPQEQALSFKALQAGRGRFLLKARYESGQELAYTLDIHVVPVWAPFLILFGVSSIFSVFLRRYCRSIKKR